MKLLHNFARLNRRTFLNWTHRGVVDVVENMADQARAIVENYKSQKRKGPTSRWLGVLSFFQQGIVDVVSKVDEQDKLFARNRKQYDDKN